MSSGAIVHPGLEVIPDDVRNERVVSRIGQDFDQRRDGFDCRHLRRRDRRLQTHVGRDVMSGSQHESASCGRDATRGLVGFGGVGCFHVVVAGQPDGPITHRRLGIAHQLSQERVIGSCPIRQERTSQSAQSGYPRFVLKGLENEFLQLDPRGRMMGVGQQPALCYG